MKHDQMRLYKHAMSLKVLYQGPVFFGDFVAPLAKIFKKWTTSYHLYADDTQVYLSFKPLTDKEEACHCFEPCLSDV